MKPDAYMPFYGNAFFLAIEMLPDEIALIYLRCCWYYWSHNHCKGLENNPTALLKLCRGNQEAVRILFVRGDSEFFSLDENFLWRQKRCDIEWAKSNGRYDRAVSGAKGRWKKKR